jgi:hypothetical protein
VTPVAVLTPPQAGHVSRVLLARRERGGTETRALIAGATVTAGASAKLVARRLEATRPRRSTTSGAIEVVMLAVELPSISAGRRAVIQVCSRISSVLTGRSVWVIVQIRTVTPRGLRARPCAGFMASGALPFGASGRATSRRSVRCAVASVRRQCHGRLPSCAKVPVT